VPGGFVNACLKQSLIEGKEVASGRQVPLDVVRKKVRLRHIDKPTDWRARQDK
jgi:hypothetical protein